MTGLDSIGLMARVQGGERPAGYYGSGRPDLVALVPAAARRVLEVGCGDGTLGRALRARGHYVCGVELIAGRAEAAARHLDEVVCGDIESVTLPWADGTFDVVLCGDVLEHLLDPWRAARRLAGLLAPGGLLISSIPNVQNYRVIRGLLRGRWEYRDSGLMDVGHLRFFTWGGIVKLYEQAGLEVVGRRTCWNRTRPRRLLNWLTRGRAEAFLTRQYLAVGRRGH